MDIQERVKILKEHESYCYQVSFYLVQDEQLSIEATTTALLELAGDPDFFKGSPEEKKEIAKRVVIRSSLWAKAATCSEEVS